MKLDIEEVKDFITKSSLESVIYIGCDSERLRRRKNGKKMVRYTVAVVIHLDGKHGARVFGGLDYEEVQDANQAKPFNRLWKEAERVVALYEELFEVLDGREYQLHIDINPLEGAGSNVVHNAAVGYIKAMTGIDPVVKPYAFAASKAADGYFAKIANGN